MPAPNAQLSVRLAFVTSNEDPHHYAELRIEDAENVARTANTWLASWPGPQ